MIYKTKAIIFSFVTVLILVYIFLFAFNGFYDKIQKQIEQQLDKKISILDLNDIYEFKWDKFYIINEDVREDEFIEIVGEIEINNIEFKEFNEKILFIRNNKIVLFENININISEPNNRKIYFDYNFEKYHNTNSKNTKYQIITLNNKSKKNYILKLL